MKLNLGCGKDFREGWINADAWAPRVDIRCDIREPLPFDDGTFSEIYASGILEQIGPNEQFRDAMNECHRILMPGGRMTAVVPDSRFAIASRDPFDCRKFTRETWNYLAADHYHYNQYGQIYGFKAWKIIQIDTNANGIMTTVLEK